MGRKSEVERLGAIVERFAGAPSTDKGLQIASISGSGGVGKSYLLEMVLNEQQPRLTNALVLKIDASDEDRLKDFNRMTDQMLAPAKLPCEGAKPNQDYFPTTRGLLRRQMELQGMVEAEIDTKVTDKQLKSTAKALYRLRPFVNMIPVVGTTAADLLEEAESAKAEEQAGAALEVLATLNALKESNGWFTNPFTRHKFSALRHSPYDVIAEAFAADVGAMLLPYAAWKSLFGSYSISGVNRLLLIVDDFEAVHRSMGDFLVQNLLPKLRSAAFSTLAIFLGRDSAADLQKDFGHHLKDNVREEIKLLPFSDSEGIAYLMAAGYPQEQAVEWQEKTRGLPFILRLLAENLTDEDKQSALFYQRCYVRTTRWMSGEEKLWLTPICYLDEVNEGTIKAVLPNEDASLVMAWFQNEASVRDVRSAVYTVTPYLRHMLLEYNRRKVGEAEHRRLTQQAEKAVESSR